jgi:hypothetical protein
MRTYRLSILCLVILFSGCATRSISDSGYQGSGYYGQRESNPFYKGELSEFDVLGIEAGQIASNEEITAAFVDNPQRRLIKKGDRIMLIQSGAMIPDHEMIRYMAENFSVSVFTGVPEEAKAKSSSYSSALRLAAAKAGISTIVVYWGILESGVENLATKTVSWVPIIGSVVPDESQTMRIRLKIAVIDVKTGEWEIFTPETLDDQAMSGRINREQSDQALVAALKAEAYKNASHDMAMKYAR